MLTPWEVVSYLEQCQLISAESVVEGDLELTDVSRRNHNFRVVTERSGCYLLKQGVGEERAATVAHEAAVYRLLERAEAGGGLKRYLPRSLKYDRELKLLILKMHPAAEDLRAYNARRRRFSTLLAAALGNALGALHALGDGALAQRAAAAGFSHRPPWILSVHRPRHGVHRDVSSAHLEIIAMIQAFPELGRLLDRLRDSWRTDCLIHHDIRWDNCVTLPKSGSRRKTRIQLVDWELASIGDPRWDLGCALSEYLNTWLFSIPVFSGQPPDRYLDLSRYPLEKMQPAMNRLWNSYRRRRKLARADSRRFLLEAVRYGAARLLQTAFEQARDAVQVTGTMVCALQLAFNLLRSPADAATRLLGIAQPDLEP